MFKIFEKRACIELILTNTPRIFQGICVMETGCVTFI